MGERLVSVLFEQDLLALGRNKARSRSLKHLFKDETDNPAESSREMMVSPSVVSFCADRAVYVSSPH